MTMETKMLAGRPEGLTICIPNWHHRNFLCRSVGSALAAARRLRADGFEAQVLVLDDHSRDGSPRLLTSLAFMDPDGLLEVVLSSSNRGLAAMRNTGLENARYRWVCFLDADNELEPETITSFLRAIRDSGATLAYGNLLVQKDGQTVALISADSVHEGVLDMNYIDAFCLVDAVRVLALGGYTGHPYARAHEDWELVLHLIAEEQDIIFVPMVLGRYHVLDLSMIRTESFDHSRLHRMFNQRRTGFPVGFRAGRIYHPDVGELA